MGDSPVKDFFDLDMKDKMRLIESRKKLEKDLIRVVYAPVLLIRKAGVEMRYNDGLTANTTVAKEDVQVVGKQLDQSMMGQFAKNVQTVIQEKAGKFKFIQPRTSIKCGIWRDIQIFYIISKKLCKKVLTKKFVCVTIIYVNKEGLEKPTGLQDQQCERRLCDAISKTKTTN